MAKNILINPIDYSCHLMGLLLQVTQKKTPIPIPNIARKIPDSPSGLAEAGR